MGSKSSSAPAPDPRLAEAQIRSIDMQDRAIQEILSQSREMRPMQLEQMRFGLDSARAAYDQSQEDRTWMLGRRDMLGRIQNDLINDARGFNTEDRRNELAGQAVGDVAQAFDGARGMALRGMTRMGVNPASGAFQAVQGRTFSDEALARASAANKTRQAARLEGFSMTDRANNALAGYASMGRQATGAGAGYGGLGLNLANSALAGMNSGFGAAGGLAGGMGQNATGAFNAQAGYKNAQDKLAADANPWGTVLGMAGTLGSAAIGKWG